MIEISRIQNISSIQYYKYYKGLIYHQQIEHNTNFTVNRN